jgi:peptide-methionine (S)-S-oxide reductase
MRWRTIAGAWLTGSVLAGGMGMGATTNQVAEAAGALERATFGAGCFWCSEAVFEQIDGVKWVKSGYMGGTLKNPTYKQVCTGQTGHAEVIQLGYDPAKVTYEQLLDSFWHMHDPTTKDRQGPDTGTQYRSVVFYHTEAQKKATEQAKAKLDKEGRLSGPVVTEIAPAGEFYPAEDYHQDFYRNNRDYPYCRLVIVPKLRKLKLKE